MNKHAYSPEGVRIIGTDDLIPGCALGNVYLSSEGAIAIDYEGETKVHWDGQYTRRSADGQPLFQCINRDVWPATRLIWSFEDTDQLLPETEEEIHEQAHT